MTPCITIHLGPWHTMVGQLFSWVLEVYGSRRAAAEGIGVARSTLRTWAEHGVPQAVRGVRRRTRGYSWDQARSELRGPGVTVARDRGVLVVRHGQTIVEVEISAVLEVLERDPPRDVSTGRPS